MKYEKKQFHHLLVLSLYFLTSKLHLEVYEKSSKNFQIWHENNDDNPLTVQIRCGKFEICLLHFIVKQWLTIWDIVPIALIFHKCL